MSDKKKNMSTIVNAEKGLSFLTRAGLELAALRKIRECERRKIEDSISLLEVKKNLHKAGRSCEFPRTCGACHFYSGAIEALKNLLIMPDAPTPDQFLG